MYNTKLLLHTCFFPSIMITLEGLKIIPKQRKNRDINIYYYLYTVHTIPVIAASLLSHTKNLRM